MLNIRRRLHGRWSSSRSTDVKRTCQTVASSVHEVFPPQQPTALTIMALLLLMLLPLMLLAMVVVVVEVV